jgi:hypothetical protein
MRRWLPLLILVAAPVIAQTLPMRVYLGEVPNPAGLTVSVNDAHEASYDDMRREYHKDAALQRRLILAESADDADLVLTIVAREDKLRGSAWTSQDTMHSLIATLTVAGTDQSVMLDGATGLKWASWKAEAKNLLKLAADWGDTNRAAIARVKAAPTQAQ